MDEKNKLIVWLIYAVLIVIAIIVGYVLVDVNIRVGMAHETSQFIVIPRGILST